MATSFTDWEGTCLAHHGIKGQKWGVRRYQNPDGTLTPAGKKREQKMFYKGLKKTTKKAYKEAKKQGYSYERDTDNRVKKYVESKLINDNGRINRIAQANRNLKQKTDIYKKSFASLSKAANKNSVKQSINRLQRASDNRYKALDNWSHALGKEASDLLGRYKYRTVKTNNMSAKRISAEGVVEAALNSLGNQKLKQASRRKKIKSR